jgi:hypothetical protein
MTPVNRIVYITALPFRERDYSRFGIPFMLNRNIKVSLIDVANIALNSSIPSRENYGNWNEIDIHVVSSKRELKSYRKFLSEADLIIDLVTSQGHTRYNIAVLREISRSRTPSMIIASNIHPGIGSETEPEILLRSKIHQIANRLGKIDFLNSLISRLPRQIFLIQPVDFIVYGGKKSCQPNTLIGKSTKSIFCHNMDYDIFLENNNSQPIETDTAVFIDQGVIGHREYLDPDMRGDFDGSNYFSQLRSMFEAVENETGLEIVIAAHPHSTEIYENEEFGKRRVIFGKSHELIAQSKLVIAHNSALIGYAVLLNKPLFLVYSRDHMYRRGTETAANHISLATSLAKKVRFLDDFDIEELGEATQIDSFLYSDFIEDYIKMKKSKSVPFWQIVLDHFSDSVNSNQIAT